jgi:hypothetical protein
MSMSASSAAVDVDHRAFCFVTEELNRILGDELNDLEFNELVDGVLAAVVDHSAADVEHAAFVFLTEQLQRIVGDDLDDLEFSEFVDGVMGGI